LHINKARQRLLAQTRLSNRTSLSFWPIEAYSAAFFYQIQILIRHTNISRHFNFFIRALIEQIPASIQ